MTTLQTIVFHTPHMTATQAGMLRRMVPGDLEQRDGFCRIRTSQAIAPETLTELRTRFPFDVNALPVSFDPARVRLLISDMDSTLINIECIDEIADFAGLKPQVSAVTAAAMRGELNFEQSLTQRVSLLAGLGPDALQRVYDERLRPNPGAEELLAWLRAREIKTAVVSGGFTFFTERLQQRLRLDFARANQLEIDNGKLTGRVMGAIVGAAGKEEFLLELCAQLKIAAGQVIALGDGANDLKMLQRAGLGIAYRAKPKVQEQAHVVINHGTLEHVRYFLTP